MSKSQYENEFWSDNLYKPEKKLEDDDKHFHKISYPYPSKIGQKEFPYTIRHFYSSGDKGSKIRDAMSGYYYNYKVGSKDEDMFYKVRLTHHDFHNQNVTCFYRSPEEFSKHHFVELSGETIGEWENKYNQYMKLNPQ